MVTKHEVILENEQEVNCTDLSVEVVEDFILKVGWQQGAGELQVTFGSQVVANPRAGNGKGGRCLFVVPLLGLPSYCDLKVSLRKKEALNRIASIVIDRKPLSLIDDDSRLCPLMITSVGRSGSTFLMRLLGAHPEIVVRLKYPFESTIARLRLHEFLTKLPNICQKARGPSFLSLNSQESPLLEVATLAREILNEVSHQYRALHQEQTPCNISPKFFAEKNLSPEWLVWEMCPGAREIFLVRDPRDMIRSSLAFNDKRGRLAFGRQDVDTDLEYVGHRAAWLVHGWLNHGWLEVSEAYLFIMKNSSPILHTFLSGFLNIWMWKRPLNE